MSDVPFRWNLARREQLGRLAGPPTAPLDDWTMAQLRECCAKVVAASADGRMVLVGRSPESLYDYLCGALADTSWADRSVLVAVKRRMRVIGITERTKNSPNTWRWYQHAPWVKGFARSALRGISIPYGFWTYLGDRQEKVSRWNPPYVWGTD